MKRSVIIIAYIVLFSIGAANAMLKAPGQDEHMYCGAAVLMNQGLTIYGDFSYVSQLPYHPLILAALYRVIPGSYYLLVGRGFSLACDIGMVLIIGWIFRLVFRRYEQDGRWPGLLASALYVLNRYSDYANGFAWNHDAVMFCILLCLALFLTIQSTKTEYLKIFVIGALLCFAAMMRATTLLVGILFIAFLIPCSGDKKYPRRILFLVCGAAALAVWPISLLLRFPEELWLNIVVIPKLCGLFVKNLDSTAIKTQAILSALTAPENIAMLLVFLSCQWYCFRQRRRLPQRLVRGFVLTLMLLAVMIFIMLIPPRFWPQYLAMPIPFVIIAAAWPLAHWTKLRSVSPQPQTATLRRRFITPVNALLAVLLIAMLSNPYILVRLEWLTRPSSWVPLRFHQTAQEFAVAIERPGKILTLDPLLALEGGKDIYIETFTGAFTLAAPLEKMSPAQRQRTHIANWEELKILLAQSPPAAVITGIAEDHLQQEMLRIAINRHWRIMEQEQTQYRLYLPPTKE